MFCIKDVSVSTNSGSQAEKMVWFRVFTHRLLAPVENLASGLCARVWIGRAKGSCLFFAAEPLPVRSVRTACWEGWFDTCEVSSDAKAIRGSGPRQPCGSPAPTPPGGRRTSHRPR